MPCMCLFSTLFHVVDIQVLDISHAQAQVLNITQNECESKFVFLISKTKTYPNITIQNMPMSGRTVVKVERLNVAWNCFVCVWSLASTYWKGLTVKQEALQNLFFAWRNKNSKAGLSFQIEIPNYRILNCSLLEGVCFFF